MRFAAIYVAGFMVQAVVRAEPGLHDCAIALLEGTAPLRKVVAANDAALSAGIELGMTESQAEDFCAVQVRLRSPVLEKTAHAALMDLGWSVSPRVEDTAADTIVLDLAGLASLLGSEEIIAERLIERASLLGLTARVAISSNLETAIHAARGFAGVTLIPSGEEAKALGGLPVSVLVTSDGLSPRAEILETLDSWGVRTCGALAALPVLDLSERMGQEGVRLHEFARGASSRAMVLAEPEVHFEEEMELEDAVPELEPLSFLLGRLLDQLCVRLSARSLAASTIRVRFELEPVSENNVRSLNDGVPRKAALPTYERILTLPVPSRNSKMLLKLLRLRLQVEPPQTAVLKIFMAAEAAKPRFAQGGLFLPSSPDPEKLGLTIARLANLVGDGNVGAPELTDTHRPDAFQIRPFVAPRVTTETASQTRGANRKTAAELRSATARDDCESLTDAHRTRMAFRVFRPSLPASVEMREGRVARVSFNGVRGEVVAASGPWCSSGDWWREDGWEHDEWDIEVRFGLASASHSASLSSLQPVTMKRHRGALTRSDLFSSNEREPSAQRGLYCIYYDSTRGSWFVRGMYD
ncbi:MAG TPA: DNA polymerase Y family protein [Candidatus Dormibacteraeota bacterium]|nr:DNA polymerase Y family protein [Candidatus Dormibacteraeota bacterium]